MVVTNVSTVENQEFLLRRVGDLEHEKVKVQIVFNDNFEIVLLSFSDFNQRGPNMSDGILCWWQLVFRKSCRDWSSPRILSSSRPVEHHWLVLCWIKNFLVDMEVDENLFGFFSQSQVDMTRLHHVIWARLIRIKRPTKGSGDCHLSYHEAWRPIVQ